MAKKITLGGKEYSFDYNLNVMIAFEEATGKELEQTTKLSKKDLRTLLYLSLKEENPDIDEKTVGKLFDAEALSTFFTTLAGKAGVSPLPVATSTARPVSESPEKISAS